MGAACKQVDGLQTCNQICPDRIQQLIAAFNGADAEREPVERFEQLVPFRNGCVQNVRLVLLGGKLACKVLFRRNEDVAVKTSQIHIAELREQQLLRRFRFGIARCGHGAVADAGFAEGVGQGYLGRVRRHS